MGMGNKWRGFRNFSTWLFFATKVEGEESCGYDFTIRMWKGFAWMPACDSFNERKGDSGVKEEGRS